MNLDKINLIISSFKLEFFKVKPMLIDKLNSQQIQIMEENADKIEVYKITYLSNNHKVNGFVIKPKDAENTPVIIYNRGGSKEFGVTKAAQYYVGIIFELVLKGYTVIGSQYSGCDGSEGNDEFGGNDLDDVLILKEIIDQLSWVDKSKIGMFGGSRGGLMTYLSLSKVNWIKAAVTWAGMANMHRNLKLRPEMIKQTTGMFDNSDQNEIDKRSPVNFTEKFCETTPLLIMHGTADWRVDPMDSIELSTNLLKNKKPFSLKLFEGTDHGLNEFKKVAINSTIIWFDRYIKNGEALPNLEPHGD